MVLMISVVMQTETVIADPILRVKNVTFVNLDTTLFLIVKR